MQTEPVVIYTDGACLGNPGPGGWGVVLMYKGKRKEKSGGAVSATNNTMELTAAIKGLESLKKPGTAVSIYTDSKYVIDGITKWIHGWRRNGWKTSSGGDVKNAGLWKELHALTSEHDVTWHWVKGHAGDVNNERADALARGGVPKV